MVTTKPGNFVGSGTFVGAVYVTVAVVVLAGMFPVSSVQFCLEEVVDLPVESVVVVVNWQVQEEISVFVLPLTVAVRRRV
jgi:hypothetical protein